MLYYAGLISADRRLILYRKPRGDNVNGKEQITS